MGAHRRGRAVQPSQTVSRSTPPATSTWPTVRTTGSRSSPRPADSSHNGGTQGHRGRTVDSPLGSQSMALAMYTSSTGVTPGSRSSPRLAHSSRNGERTAPTTDNSRYPEASQWTTQETCTCSTSETTGSRSSPQPARSSRNGVVDGSGDGQFHDPTGVAVDGAGNVYVTDANNNQVQKFTSNGTFVTQWGS